jgi:hypothetical protein
MSPIIVCYICDKVSKLFVFLKRDFSYLFQHCHLGYYLVFYFVESLPFLYPVPPDHVGLGTLRAAVGRGAGQHLQHRLRVQLGVTEYMSVIRYRAERYLAVTSSTVSMNGWGSEYTPCVQYRAGQYL